MSIFIVLLYFVVVSFVLTRSPTLVYTLFSLPTAALELVEALDFNRRVVAVGVNCTNPAFLSRNSGNIVQLRGVCRCCPGKGTCEKAVDRRSQEKESGGLAFILGQHRHGRAVVLYPNSGEEYNADTKSWEAPTSTQAQADASGGTVTVSSPAPADGSTWEANAAVSFSEAAVNHWAPAIAWEMSPVAAAGNGVLCVGGCCQTGTITTTSLRSAFEKVRNGP